MLFMIGNEKGTNSTKPLDRKFFGKNQWCEHVFQSIHVNKIIEQKTFH